jgi:2-dehydro-3-deoxygalactonokinase
MDIFIDWGSTNFHAFLVQDGRIEGRREVPGQGILTSFGEAQAASRVAGYSAFLNEAIGPWLREWPDAALLMCGAIGSREGWIETTYVEAPAGFAEVAAGVTALAREECGCLAGRSMAIVSGLALKHRDGRHDVMRSEEVKGLGAAAHLCRGSALLCIPGTHCKWLRIEAGKIVDFHTVLSGDIYGLLIESGSLAPLFTGAFDGVPVSEAGSQGGCFDQGLSLAKMGGDLLIDLWQVRSRKLHDAHPPADLRSYLSGILIGHELRQMRTLHRGTREIILVSDPGSRRELYRRACGGFGFAIGAEIDSATAVCAGLTRIRRLLT